MAQVLSVSYRADFGHQNKVSLVTANSPGTVTSPLILGGTKQYCEGRTQSSSSSTNQDVSRVGAQTVRVWLLLRISRYPMTCCLSRYVHMYLASDMGRHRFRVVDNGPEVGLIQAILQAVIRHWVQSFTTII